MKKLALGNYGIARGAYEAGVTVAAAYPGTPSTEITEFVSEYPEIKAEWSANEKVSLEVAVGASIGGARSLVCMKHVGLNVAADPLFTAAYTGVNGGLVVVVADDPAMHSSQNEQDSRFYSLFSHVPMLEPSDSRECVEFTKLAFEMSEKYDTPILVRLTTRVAHSQSFIEFGERKEIVNKPYIKNVPKYVMMPSNAVKRHIVVEKRMDGLSKDCNGFEINRAVYKDKSIGIVTAGNVYNYVCEALPDASVYKIGTVHPLPIEEIRKFSGQVDKLIVIEELEPFIENQLKANGINCIGKELFSKQGELNANLILKALKNKEIPVAESLPVRPPIMCPGCPHRSVFYTLNRLKYNVFGDIGCYTLGALSPLSSVDAVLCMGASISMAAGWEKANGFDKKTVAVIGDSTFIHSGITGLINAVYNGLNTKILILDNSTTGMTGHQNNPANGKNIYGDVTAAVDLKALCYACGVKNVTEADAYDLLAVEKVIKEETARDGVGVVIIRRACALIVKGGEKYSVNEQCTNCKMCMKTGCPAIECDKKPIINQTVCNGCGVCAQCCKFGAIVKK